MPGIHAPSPVGMPSAKLAFHCVATSPATSVPAMTATLVAMFTTPLARASFSGATSSAIMPYFTGPKNALTVANAISAATVP